MEYPVPGVCNQAVLAEFGEVLVDGELDDLAGQGDRGRQRVGDFYCWRHGHLLWIHDAVLV
jgi:hypothetical protein